MDKMNDRNDLIIDIQALFLMARRRALLFLVVAAIVLAAVAALYTAMEPKYTASARILVDTREQRVVTEDLVVQDDRVDTYSVDTEARVLSSRSLARRVVEKLDLANNPDFLTKDDDESMTDVEAVTAATTALQDGLSVSRSGLAFVIDVAFTHSSPEMATTVVNTLVTEYVNAQLELKRTATREASSFLKSRLDELRQTALAADQRLAEFRTENPMLSSEDDQSVVQRQLADLSNELAEASAAYAEVQAALEAARQLAQSGGSASVGNTRVNTSISALRAQEAEAVRQVAELSRRYGPRHPSLLIAQDELVAIRGQLTADVQRNVDDLEAQAAAARSRVTSLRRSLDAVSATLQDTNSAKATLSVLEREAATAGATYEAFLKRFGETSTQEGVQTADSRILSLADTPSDPSWPDPLLFALIGFVCAAGAGGAAVIARELMENGLRTPSDVRDTFSKRLLSIVPSFQSSLTPTERRQYKTLDAGFMLEKPNSTFAESFRILLASMMQQRGDIPAQVIAVTSAVAGEGKTTVSFGLARVVSMAGQSVVVVECASDGAMGPGMENAVGLVDVLAGRADFEDAILRDDQTGAYFLPLFGQTPLASPILGTPQFDELLAELRNHFDRVILDTPPVLSVADSRVLCAKADAVAYVVKWGDTAKGIAVEGYNLLWECGAMISGIVLNNVDLKKQRAWTSEGLGGGVSGGAPGGRTQRPSLLSDNRRPAVGSLPTRTLKHDKPQGKTEKGTARPVFHVAGRNVLGDQPKA
ncbi:hypothetical protein PB2503_06857 [Parvularcula bermudensis HTCC2503]|uniref:non-specific protein-tyrosine kinase n=1 Tax=Parvularcula bermudensis (strain ATCC BAA-594 / HTCC2503 / KCTC 12087) TaxID=314260 RepID=E0TI98_PARBH|nr:polysaccharide biosynthesis tyrosine autokinase [Parvularcula bermudensis]ADM09437.1 hypothetical protein PB2503_06857 [Parvularcula bermudensis HTCC2503]